LSRFILEKCDGSLVIENKKKKLMVQELIRKGFDPDPVKKWKANQVSILVESSGTRWGENSRFRTG
jgi:DNA topoisomerase-2